MSKLSRKDYDELDRAVSEVESAESSGRVGSHASMRAKLSRVFIQAILHDRPCAGRFWNSSLDKWRDVQEEYMFEDTAVTGACF